MGKLRLDRVAVLLLAASAVLGVAAGSTTAAASTLAGAAITTSPGTSSYLDSGGSETPFTVSLPHQAACSGDSRSDGYRVFSYLVQPKVSVSTITFHGGLPDARDSQYGLVEADGTYWGDANTAPTTGQIIQIPNDFEWGPLVTDDGVPLDTLLYQDGNTSGAWDAGIACANTAGTITDYWNTQVTFTATSSRPNHFGWSAVPGQQVAATHELPNTGSPAPTGSAQSSTAPFATQPDTQPATPPATLPTTSAAASPSSTARPSPTVLAVAKPAPEPSHLGRDALIAVAACIIVALLLLGLMLNRLRSGDR
jgi:hypothetical protein